MPSNWPPREATNSVRTRQRPRKNLRSWLNVHPNIADAIQWEDPPGLFTPYWYWSEGQKRYLDSAYALAHSGQTFAPPDPVYNLASASQDAAAADTVLSPHDAWGMYLAYVAQSLHIEVNRGVPWSVTASSPDLLEQLFSSKYMFGGTNEANGPKYHVLHWPPAGWVTPSRPSDTYHFLRSQSLIGPDRISTITSVVEWCRYFLDHFLGGLTFGNVEAQWQYRGLPPVSRIITGTPFTGQQTELKHRTAGCHGTNGFLNCLLRVVNIVCKYVMPPYTGHATPRFPADGISLSHGDDPYNAFSGDVPFIFPTSELFIDDAKYDAWFGDQVPAADRNNNIGRRTAELALIYLPTYLLWDRCRDIAAGTPKSASHVANNFGRWYTVADLDALNLWPRLDAKIASLGGCGNIQLPQR